jgi:hypothetical protein
MDERFTTNYYPPGRSFREGAEFEDSIYVELGRELGREFKLNLSQVLKGLILVLKGKNLARWLHPPC